MTERAHDGLREELRRFYRTSEAYLKMLRTPLSMSIPERDEYYACAIEIGR